ncbi:hypothetical protein AGLY_015667 [Aphis glycines]|uniref:Uncharacterized protein n=1 Tax=Aphis glycines TaxID=307491 RepID=A0A6G0T045_APHGL|nr:hypothetical protein AGLY_015667 [Aphis glycines]
MLSNCTLKINNLYSKFQTNRRYYNVAINMVLSLMPWLHSISFLLKKKKKHNFLYILVIREYSVLLNITILLSNNTKFAHFLSCNNCRRKSLSLSPLSKSRGKSSSENSSIVPFLVTLSLRFTSIFVVKCVKILLQVFGIPFVSIHARSKLGGDPSAIEPIRCLLVLPIEKKIGIPFIFLKAKINVYDVSTNHPYYSYSKLITLDHHLKKIHFVINIINCDNAVSSQP